ncbi:MAG: ribosomal-processing cysteine protease Prp [Lachnospiraceae bacterium]|nr:ribosomal-processing cysteine protease Prp [Lachnospiraceae bacterium]
MISISIQREKDQVVAFSVMGHAGYADEGYDIVCASVSALCINAVNSVLTFTSDMPKYEASDGNMSFRLTNGSCPETQLLLESMILGLKSVADQYPQFVTIVD